MRYAAAILAAVAALVLRASLSPWIGQANPYLTVWAALVFAAWYCGVGPSLVITLISFLAVWYCFLPPLYSWRLQDPRTQVPSAIAFLMLSGCIIALGEANRRSKAKFERSDFRFRRLVGSNIIPLVCTRMETITHANDAFLNVVGYSREDLAAGKINWKEITASEYAPRDVAAVKELETLGFCKPFEKEYIRKDGGRVPVLVGGTALCGSPLETLAFVFDLSRTKQVEAEFRDAHHQLEQKVEERTQELAETIKILNSEIRMRRKNEEDLGEMSARLLRLQDEERCRIARELHDSTGQTLTALKLTIASLERLVTTVPDAPNLVDDLNALADQGLREVRTIAHLLHPPMLEEAGFPSAAQWYVDEFARRSGIKASLKLCAGARQLSKAQELVLFRVLQESLTNVLRHSGSKVVDIHLESSQQNTVLSVKDYGKGISSEKLDSFHRGGAGVGVGLAGMKQRVDELRGRLSVECDGTGTCVIATLPLGEPRISHHSDDLGLGKAAPAA